MTTKMRPFTSTIPLAEARAIVDRTIEPLNRRERIALADAYGRVLASEAVARADVPPFSRAAMDGYAVRAGDIAGASRDTPRTLDCIETVFTGQLAAHVVGAGQCVQIATGAPMPDGADAVVMVEDTISDGGRVQFSTAVSVGQNIGRRGADIQAGQSVLEPGERLGPARVGALAALGLTHVEVFAKPTVAILSTGNEIIDPGSPLNPGQIYDVNKFTLAAVIAEHGGVPVPHRTALDTLDDLSRAVDECLRQDVLVFSGGSSVGERDLILDIIAQRGQVLFHGISVKPGKPTAFGIIDGKPVFGMPGYPTSCLTNAYILLAPALHRIARLPPIAVRTVSLPLSRRIASAAARHQFYTVRIEAGRVVPAFKASGDITSMSSADGYIEIPTTVSVIEAGEMVTVTLF